MKTIAYQGVKGSFSFLTAQEAWGPRNVFIGVDSFQGVFDLLHEGHVEYGVIPIENSLVGSIYENYDWISRYESQIIAEHYTRIEHCLLAKKLGNRSKSERLEDIRKVISHPKALEQCRTFFQKYPWMEAVVHQNTATAAAEVEACHDPSLAAIASATAGDLYDLEILEKGIEDNQKNYTRFVTLRTEKSGSLYGNKCSLMVTLPHKPGSLLKMLQQFSDRNMNLTKIESRPIPGSPFEYTFYIDIVLEVCQKNSLDELLVALLGITQTIKVLGIYESGGKIG